MSTMRAGVVDSRFPRQIPMHLPVKTNMKAAQVHFQQHASIYQQQIILNNIYALSGDSERSSTTRGEQGMLAIGGDGVCAAEAMYRARSVLVVSVQHVQLTDLFLLTTS